ncbi:MAG: hypothetical protein DMG50_20845 [Acidobacteria bacterium]|nr:MAG: hypothetical protein DMG50_20845 [Acidobacteriota bacterium]
MGGKFFIAQPRVLLFHSLKRLGRRVTPKDGTPICIGGNPIPENAALQSISACVTWPPLDASRGMGRLESRSLVVLASRVALDLLRMDQQKKR